jgi:hypothetical protein
MMITKDTGLRIRVERDLRDSFLDTCRKQDRPAAQVIREFMREYVANNAQSEVRTPLSHSQQQLGRARTRKQADRR